MNRLVDIDRPELYADDRCRKTTVTQTASGRSFFMCELKKEHSGKCMRTGKDSLGNEWQVRWTQVSK